MGPVIISLETIKLTEEEQQILSHPNIAGIILFTRNFKNKQQITDLISSIRAINHDLLIMVDHEGGRVWRFKNEEFINPGSMQALGRLYDVNKGKALADAFNYGKQIAIDLLTCGIDLNLAPVLDLYYDGVSSVIGDRAFHYDSQVVTLLAEQFIRGQLSVGMQAVGKHFPGHGAIAADTHTDKAIDYRDFQVINEQDLEPFAKLIENNILSAVMPAHVIYPAIDSKPAGFSTKWLKEILRKRLQFNGAIISDCLSMYAAQQFISQELDLNTINLELVKKALTAGCDLVIFNGLHGKKLLYLLDNLQWNLSEAQTIRINSLKIAWSSYGPTNFNKPKITA